MIWLWLGWGAHAASAQDAPPDVAVDADHLERDGSSVDARGRVRVQLGETVIRADTLSWQDGEITVGPGVLHGALDGAFTGGHFDLNHGESTLFAARVDRTGAWLSAERLSVSADGWSATDVRFSACLHGCPWVVTARAASADAQRVRLRGGVLHVGPARIPLPPLRWDPSRRWRMAAPTVEAGYDGIRVRQPLTYRAGDTLLRVAPELRTHRGITLITEHSGPSGATDARLGWDWRVGGLRGGARWSERWQGGAVAAATTGQFATDADYFRDTAPDMLTRRVPWFEARGLIGVPRAEAWIDRFAATRTGGVPMIGITARRTEEYRGIRADAQVRGWMDHQGLPGAHAQLMSDRPTRVGPLVATPRLSTELRAATEELRGTGSIGVDLAMPGWRSVRSGTERLDPTVGARWELGEPRPRLRTSIGWRHVGHGVAELRASVGTRPNGATQAMSLRWTREGLTAWAQADGPLATLPTRAMATVRARVSWIEFDLGGFHAPHVNQLQVGASLVGPIRPNLAMIATPNGKLQSLQAGFSWTHPSGCAGLDVVVRQDADRAVPDVLIGVNAGPATRAAAFPLVSRQPTPYRD